MVCGVSVPLFFLNLVKHEWICAILNDTISKSFTRNQFLELNIEKGPAPIFSSMVSNESS